MDERSFGELTKRVAAADSRRGMVRVLAGGLTASALSLAAGGRVVSAAFGFCRAPGTKCSKDKKCCSGTCRNGACGCIKNGGPCINRVGIACCAQRCREGKCG